MADDLLPPPPAYTEKPPAPSSGDTVSPSSPPGASTSVTGFITAHLSSHVSSLPARIRAAQTAHTTRQAAHDLDLVSLLVPHVDAFLAHLGGLARPPPVAELALVPAAAVPDEWALSGAAERVREGEVVRAVRVRWPDDRVAAGDSKGGTASDGLRYGQRALQTESEASCEFDSWGRWDSGRADAAGRDGAGAAELAWWSDEDMAQRLASYLQPRPQATSPPPQPPAGVERRQVQTAVEQAREKRHGSPWLRKIVSGGSSVPAPSAKSPPPPPPTTVRQRIQLFAQPADNRVAMRVSGQEVTFRRENDFGIWETMSGYGIVVVVQIQSTR